MKRITIEETLSADHISADALADDPFLLYSEIIEGARRPLAFLQVVSENFDLIGATGHMLKYLKVETHKSTAEEWTEADSPAEMTATSPVLTSVTISVPKVIFSAIELSDLLAEEYPSVEWMRFSMREMGKAIMEFLDADVYGVITAGAGVTHDCGADDFAYADIVDALAKMENNNWAPPTGTNSPWLLMAPDSVAALMKDTLFIRSERYTPYEIAHMVAGEAGKFAGCRVLKTPLLNDTGYAFIVFPKEAGYGEVVTIGWKRRMGLKNQYFAKYAYTYFVSTIRAKPVVLQGKGICKLYTSLSP